MSRTGYYNWLTRQDSDSSAKKEEQDKKDFELILLAYNYRGYDKGSRGIHMRLLRAGIVMNRKKIQRLMRQFGLKCPIRNPNPYKQMAKAVEEGSVFKNVLARRFRENGPRTVILTDITYLFYGPERLIAYLSVMKDAFTKEILAYVLSESLEEDFVLKTVDIMYMKHGDELSDDCIIHSDQGIHYKAKAFQKLVKQYNITQSMSRKANCWDNAPQESFFGHMKDEVDIDQAASFSELIVVIDDYMDYYNNDRPQWELAKLTPSEYYEYCMTGDYPLKDLIGLPNNHNDDK